MTPDARHRDLIAVADAADSPASTLQDSLGRLLAELPRMRTRGDVRSVCRVLTSMGRIHVRLREWDSAHACFEEAEELAGRGLTPLRWPVSIGRAELQLYRGDLDGARRLLETAIARLKEIGDGQAQAEATRLLGIVYGRSRDHRAALEHLGQAADLGRAHGALLAEAEAESERARVLQAEGRNREALASLARARTLYDRLRMSSEVRHLRRRLDELERRHLHVVKAWGESIESKDRYTAGHCDRVARYACLLAEATGFGEEQMDALRIGAFLHDVGKTAVPAEVLNKPGKLTDPEWALMKSHTEVGDRMIAQLHLPWDIRPIVRSHHEKWDGTGYPDGLEGDEIPTEARILCLADVFDALTTTRSYRRALSWAEALEIMERDAGRGLDPQLFPPFLDRIKELQDAGTDEAR